MEKRRLVFKRWPKGKLRATCRATWVRAQPAQLGRNLGAYRRNQHNLGATWGVIGATRRAPVRSRAIPSAIPISACAAAALVIAGLSTLSRTSDHYNAASSCLASSQPKGSSAVRQTTPAELKNKIKIKGGFGAQLGRNLGARRATWAQPPNATWARRARNPPSGQGLAA